MIETPPPVAFLDASVLYPALLRNLLMYFAVNDLFQARWSARVHEEWIGALLRNRPDISRAQLERTRRLMEAEIEDALVEGYERHIEALLLPDADDRHVLAAAIQCAAQCVITTNLRDFPESALAPFGLAALHPDEFLSRLTADEPDTARVAFLSLCRERKNPAQAPHEVTQILRRQGLAATAEALDALLA